MSGRAKIISIILSEGENGLFHATSPQMPELFVTGASTDQALGRVQESIEALYAIDGVKVKAVPADGQDLPIPQPWIVFDNACLDIAC